MARQKREAALILRVREHRGRSGEHGRAFRGGVVPGRSRYRLEGQAGLGSRSGSVADQHHGGVAAASGRRVRPLALESACPTACIIGKQYAF